jgi:TATA-binding protein-associated factor Taf7
VLFLPPERQNQRMSHELYYHQQLILRLPSDLAEKISHILTHSKPIDSANPPIQIEVTYQGSNLANIFANNSLEKSYFEFVYGEEKYPAILSHLPCNIETHKTFDHITYYKSSDISQVRQID